MKLRNATIIVCLVDAAVWVFVAFATFISGSDAATKGLDEGAGLIVTALFLVTGAPALALVLLGRAPKTALTLALAFPAAFAVLFVAAVIAFARPSPSISAMPSDRSRQESRPLTGVRIESPSRDLPKIIDVLRGGEHVGIAGPDEGIEVRHDTVLPKERAAAAGRVARNADDLAPFVDAMGFAIHVSGKSAEILDTIMSRPEERVQLRVVGIVTGLTGKTDDVTLLIDGHRRVPRVASEVADIGDPAVFPEHGVRGGESSNRLVTSARDADDLASVVDRGSSAGGVPGEHRKFADLASVRLPDDSAKLQDLGRDAGRVMHGVLRPPDDLAMVVRAGGKAVIAPQRRKRAHHARLPHEPKACRAGSGSPGEKSRTTPVLAQRIRRVGLGDPCDQTDVVLHGPRDAAVGSAESAEVE
jgi:hypothetical protein